MQAYNKRLFNGWEALRSVRKPLIAAVNGYALGGGCELALMCDIIIAADTAALGQPEITLGVIPGMGGTQRLTRAVGKSRAMEIILTGARVSANEAARIGLVSRAVPAAELMQEVRHVAKKIAQNSMPAVAKAKECVNASFEGSLAGKRIVAMHDIIYLIARHDCGWSRMFSRWPLIFIYSCLMFDFLSYDFCRGSHL